SEQDVAAEHDLLAADRRERRSALEAPAVRRGALDHRLEQIAVLVVRDVQQIGHRVREQLALEPAPERLLFQQQLPGGIDRDDEAESLAAAALGDIVRDEADDLAGEVEHRAT